MKGAAGTKFFLTALEGLSESDADRIVLPYPSHEIDPYRGLPPHLGVTSWKRAAGKSCGSISHQGIQRRGSSRESDTHSADRQFRQQR